MRALLFSLVLACVACGSKEAQPGSPQHPITSAELRSEAAVPGELQYRRYCIGCHGDDGRGNGGVTGANLTAKDGPLFTKGDDELLVSVRDGKTGKFASMPAHRPILSEAQIRDVLAYVRKRFGGDSVR